MKIIDNILYLNLEDAVECGLGSDNYIKKEKSRGAKWATFSKDPRDNRKMLIKYESLHPNKKKLVNSHYGNPYEYYSKAPIRAMVTKDTKAESFYFDYRINDNSLSEENISKYTTAASWLNMLVKAQDNFKSIKDQLSITRAKFWQQVSEIIEQEKVALPNCYKRLLLKIDTYKSGGYESLIHKLHGKANAAKINDEIKQSLLLELISIPNADDVLTARRYNKWASQNDHKQISSRTVTNWKLENKYLISPEKYGTKENYNEFGKHIIRKRPSAPLLLVEHDDNELDLYFQNTRTKNNRTEVYYYTRYVIAVVVDAYNDYPLGWAIAETYTKELIRFAYLDAVHHIKELTGGWHLPYQIRSDRFGLDAKATNDLGQFYKSLAIYTPAAVKVARGKYIERSFGKQWHQVLSCFKNYAGTNITSQTHISQEFIELNKKDYPTTEQAPVQIAHFINTMRHLINEKTGLSRQEQWIKAFTESDKSKQCAITEAQMLFKLGTPHTHLNKITNRGITPSINGADKMYEVPEELYLKTIGATVQIIYDVMDYSRILVTNGNGILFVAHETKLMPSAIADFEPGDRARINDRLEQKVRHMNTVTDAKTQRQTTLARERINTESLIMAGVHTKAINHDALLSYGPGNNIAIPEKRKIEKADKENTEYDPFDDM